MSTENIFEYATRNKMRFPYRGSISIEDLWDLPLTGLDTVYKTLNKQVKQSQEESLLNVKTKEDETLDIQIAIVKYIVSVKLAEKVAREKAAENRAKRQEIMSIMAARDKKALENASDEELQKMLDDLSE